MMESSIPAAAAEVAAPIRKLCPEEREGFIRYIVKYRVRGSNTLMQ